VSGRFTFQAALVSDPCQQRKGTRNKRIINSKQQLDFFTPRT